VRRFVFVRYQDISGYSGPGVVVEGVEFSDGRVAMRWCVGDNRSYVIFDSIAAAIDVHGHDGATQLEWIDSEAEGALYTAAKEYMHERVIDLAG